MNKTTLDISVLENLDFDLECEGRGHDTRGAGEVVAIVKLQPPCCKKPAVSKNLCVGCLAFSLTYPSAGRHRDGCGNTWFPFRAEIKEVKYL
jgi:hypothetical protein